MEVFTAIGDPTRRSILDQLRVSERSAKELTTPRPMSQPALSQHLKVLRTAGLVDVRRAGRHRIYSLQPQALMEIARWLRHYEQFWDDKLDALGAYLDAQEQGR